MTLFTFSIDNPNQQYIRIQAEFNVLKEETLIHLPSWRPGRYELGNFAKNVRNFKVLDDMGKFVGVEKVGKDTWKVETKSTKKIKVTYLYYAAELNAGSTFLDETQLYVNPVNCCVFIDDAFNDEIVLNLMIPESWEIATSLTRDGDSLKASNYDELLDSPFIASGQLQLGEYESFGVKFHVWFNGEIKPDWERLIGDFKAFTDKQIEKFVEFPVKEYHFINQILPYKVYHGVEHQRSTVIALGPSYDVFGELYPELLGVSSHELYHTWNVKAIRPIEMYPYDFTKENYSRLGYICEGVTTYQGDLFLLKSGVFSVEQYLLELNKQLQRHFDNAGRFNYSVAESSFDTWLDGYSPGAPGRKVSIYTEGCLLAFVCDVIIRKATNSKSGLDDVMKRLYFEHALNGKGVSEEDYRSMLEKVSGEDFEPFFKDYVNGCRPYESIITNALDYLGMELIHEPSPSYAESKLGFKWLKSTNGTFIVKAMYPGGPAETGGVVLEDEIVAVNGYACKGELDKWLSYFDEDVKQLTVVRGGAVKVLALPEVNRNFYMKYQVVQMEQPNNHQKRAFELWSK